MARKRTPYVPTYLSTSKHNNSKESWRWHGCGGSKHLVGYFLATFGYHLATFAYLLAIFGYFFGYFLATFFLHFVQFKFPACFKCLTISFLRLIFHQIKLSFLLFRHDSGFSRYTSGVSRCIARFFQVQFRFFKERRIFEPGKNCPILISRALLSA